MWVMTFHSACVRFLRREAGRFGYPSSFSIYDQADSERLMALACRELDLDAKHHPHRAMLAQVSTLKNELIDHETFAARAEGYRERALAEAYGEYQRRLVAAGAMDFDDLIMNTVFLLQAFPDVAQAWRQRFRHVLVDEYQDTNHAQYVLVRELVTADGQQPAAGGTRRGGGCGSVDLRVPRRDHPQYRGVQPRFPRRHGDPAGAELPLHAEHPGGRERGGVQEREAGRRSACGPTPVTAPPIVGYVADSEHDEAAFVAEEVDRLTDEGEATPGQVAVFYRTNAQSRVFEEVFIRAGLPYKVVGGVRFYERREVRDLLAYLRLIANPEDEVSLRRILNVPRRGIGDRAEACVAALAQRDRSVFAAALARPARRRPGSRPGRRGRSRRSTS